MQRRALGEIRNGETRKEIFDFSSQLAVGETLSSGTVTSAVYSGTDASPSAVISGGASVSGGQLTQTLIGQVAGTVYALTATAVTSTSQTLKMLAYLVVVA